MPSARAAPPAGATAYRRWLASDVYTSSCSLHNPHLLRAHTHAISAPLRFVCKQLMSHMVVCLISAFGSVSGQISITRSRGVTVSTLDPESSDRGSNPRETSCMPSMYYCVVILQPHSHHMGIATTHRVEQAAVLCADWVCTG